MSLEILESGFLSTIQDLGRPASMQWGVPAGGAMDRYALRAANKLTGNPPGTAQIECYAVGLRCRSDTDLVIAAGGAGFCLGANEQEFPLWMSVFVQAGHTFELLPRGQSGWGILAVSGGLDVPLVLGSRSTNMSAGWGGHWGRALIPGDRIATGVTEHVSMDMAGRAIPPGILPRYGDPSSIQVIPACDQAGLEEESKAEFYSTPYRVTETSNRAGLRLAGKALRHTRGADILSEGTAFGTVQIPGDGQPIVLMSDAQPTGGYCKLGVIASASLPVLAQTPMQTVDLGFRPCAAEAARREWLGLLHALDRLEWDENGEAVQRV